MVLASATVDAIGGGRFCVHVYNDSDTREYEVEASSEDEAAREGISKFVAEFITKEVGP